MKKRSGKQEEELTTYSVFTTPLAYSSHSPSLCTATPGSLSTSMYFASAD